MVGQGDVRARKPLLDVEQQIGHLKSKGVRFELCSEKMAAEYLERANNYLRVASYRKLYFRQVGGGSPGAYVNLDFQDLVDLSAIDRRLREALLGATIDVEHFAKLRLLQRCAGCGEDGYSIVGDYLSCVSSRQRSRIEDSLKARCGGKTRDAYSGNLIAHYAGAYPIWVFLEVTDFGTFVDLWRFCSSRWGDSELKAQHYVLKSVRSLRNACAHNSLIVNGFSRDSTHTSFSPPRLISVDLNRRGMRNTKSRRAKLANLRISQIAATFYAVSEFCGLDSTKHRHARRLRQVEDYAKGCGVLSRAHEGIVSYFDFTWRLVDIWLPLG